MLQEGFSSHFADAGDVVQGGLFHRFTPLEAERRLGIDIPVFGMVKDDRHRTRALMTPQGQEIGIQRVPAVFALVGQIQEETHRFAIEFHRQQQNQRVKKSALDDIPGIGPKRRTELLKAFKSVKQIKAASLAELEEAVGKATGKVVYDWFREEKRPEEPGETQ